MKKINDLVSLKTDKPKFKKVFKIVMLIACLVVSITIVLGTIFSFKNKTALADVNFPSVPPVGDSDYPTTPNPFYLPTVYKGISFSKAVLVGLGNPGVIDTRAFPQLIVYFFDNDSKDWDWYYVNSINVQNGSASGSTALLTFQGRADTLCQIQYTPLGKDKYQVNHFTINHNEVPQKYDYFAFVCPNWNYANGSIKTAVLNVIFRSTRSGFYQVGYDSGYENGYNQGVIEGGNQQLNKLNPVSYFLEPVSTFLSTPLFGNFSIGAALSIVMFVSVALIFIKMFAGG